MNPTAMRLDPRSRVPQQYESRSTHSCGTNSLGNNGLGQRYSKQLSISDLFIEEQVQLSQSIPTPASTNPRVSHRGNILHRNIQTATNRSTEEIAMDTTLVPFSPSEGLGNREGRRITWTHTPSSNNGSFHPVIVPPKPSTFELYPLIAETLSPKSRGLYEAAYAQFYDKWQLPLRTIRQLDEALAAYICEAYFEDPTPSNRQRMTYLLAFIVLSHPEYRNKIGLARRALKGWKRKVPSKASYPLTKKLMLAFVHSLVQHNQKMAATAIAVQWGAYLRGTEVLSLTGADIVLPGDPRLDFSDPCMAGIQIRFSKTGPMQFTPIRDRDVLALLQSYLHGVRNKRGLLFPLYYSTYLSIFKHTAGMFNLTGFTTHSARIGGALHDFGLGKSAETIAITGRWASFSSLRHYLQNGRAWLLQMPLSEDSKRDIEDGSRKCRALIDACLQYITSIGRI